MAKRIDSLTDAHRARFDEWADMWIEIGLRTGEADWQRHERAARRCYVFANIPWPGLVVRVPSPIVGALAAPIATHLLSTGMDRASAVNSAMDIATRSVSTAPLVGPSTDVGSPGEATNNTVAANLAAIGNEAMRQAVREGWRQYLGGQFWVGGWGWGGAWTSFFREVVGLELPGDLWDRAKAYEETMKSACWWWPTRSFVMVCQRPAVISREQIGPRGWQSHRLHNESGPALAWEGWPLYYIHGVRVSSRVVEHPEMLTPSEIVTQPNSEVRRVMIERFGVDRLMHEANAELMDEEGDPGGPTSRRLLRLRLDGDEPIVMVRVVNSTPEPDGHWKSYMLRVPPTTRTCREAVAWTFGMESGEYSPLAET